MSSQKSPIPIKNLFYMLCYAWNVLAVKDDVMKVGGDDYDDAYNLLARIFSYGIDKLIRSGFYRSYVERKEELPSVRGKILLQDSINAMSIYRTRLVCEYDEYSLDNSFNRILKYTIDALLRNQNIDAETKKPLKKQSAFFDSVKGQAPTKETRQQIIFSQSNASYRLLISIASMLYDNTTVNEENGEIAFKDFFRQNQMHKVFESFILNFYKIHLSKENYQVYAPKINWHIEENAKEIWGDFFDIADSPGDRRTDIVVENKSLGLQMIFDAKYYQQTFVDAYRNSGDKRIRVSHLNQLRGYLIDSEFDGRKIGALLYPMVNDDLSRGVVHAIEGTPIIVKTINLNDNWRNIEEDLLNFVYRIESSAQKITL